MIEMAVLKESRTGKRRHDPIFFHGRLERLLGNDIGEITNLDDLPEEWFVTPDRSSWLSICKKNVWVKVTGIAEPCLGFFWMIGITQRGLVCLKSDLEALKYCREMFEKNSPLI